MGARQVGKTTTLNHFARTAFENFIYVNFELQKEVNLLFERDLEPERIVKELALLSGQKIEPEKTLIIFDEVQECREAVTSLKYFYEKAPQYCIVAAGSLVGISLGHRSSFPVGKVDFLTMYPLSFDEYIRACDQKLIDAYDYYLTATSIEPIPLTFFNPLIDLFKQYILSGGMPEPAKIVQEEQDILKAVESQNNIINAYRIDFAKHTNERTAIRLNYLWNSIPSQLAKENKKFLYRTIKTGARAREYEEALSWLEQADLICKVYKITKPGIPLKAYEDLSAFKIYLLDTGLLGAMAGLHPQAYILGDRLFTEFKGALIENYICQCLKMQNHNDLWYWTSNRIAEVDFVIQHATEVIPIEVKSDLSIRSKSFAQYKKLYHPRIRLRFSIQNLTLDDDLLNIPLFYADHHRTFLDKSILNR